MKTRIRILCAIAALGILAPLARAQEPSRGKPFERPPKIIEVTAANFEFVPAVIHVRAGQNILLRVTATDKTHGIRINPFPDGANRGTPPGLEFLYGEDCWKLKKGEMVKIELIGHTPGTYTFSCCKQCGSGHKRMKGQLVVEP